LTRRRFRRDPTHALFADQSQSIPENLVALFGRIRACNYSADRTICGGLFAAQRVRNRRLSKPNTVKSRKHIEENVRAADIVFTPEDLAEIDRIVPPGTASGSRYPIGQMDRLNV
jgi:hypothetical protein